MAHITNEPIERSYNAAPATVCVDSVEVRVVEYYSMLEVAKMLHVHHSRVKEWATRTDDPLPFRIFPGMRRGAFISREDLYAWLSENTVLFSEQYNSLPYGQCDGGTREVPRP